MKFPNRSMLLRIAQADAYAMAVEFLRRPEHDYVFEDILKFERYIKHPKLDLPAAWYSDDTQMSIAVTEVLLEGPPYTREMFARAFVRCFKRDQRQGYSRKFQAFLESIETPEDFLAKIDSSSIKNGACMRAVPLGVLSDPTKVLEVARLQASLTHDTDEGIYSAQMVALMSHFFLHTDEDPIWLDSFLRKHMPRTAKSGRDMTDWIPSYTCEDGTPPWNERVNNTSGIAFATVQAVYRVLVDYKTLMEMLKKIIEWGGDTDSVAAIAWGIASARYQDEQLPDFMERDLEPGNKYGPTFLSDLGGSLMSKFR